MVTSLRLRRVATTGAALAIALTLSACSAGSDGDTTADTEQSSSTTTAGDSAGGDSQQAAEQAGIDTKNLPTPLATATVPGQIDGDPAATLDIAVLQLRRSGKTVVLTYSVTPHTTQDKADNLYQWFGESGTQPTLVDTTNLRLHRIPEQSNGVSGDVMTNLVNLKAASGQTVYVYAVFAAPPDDVTTMSVNVADGIPAMIDVPVQPAS